MEWREYSVNFLEKWNLAELETEWESGSSKEMGTDTTPDPEDGIETFRAFVKNDL